MAATDDVLKALKDAGAQLKADLWKPEDGTFLEARAKDLVGLEAKAATLKDGDPKKAAYTAAARDTIVSVKLLALIRMETAEKHLLDALGKFFLTVAVPAV